MKLKPTGKCFDDAFEFVQSSIGDLKDRGRYELCHGIGVFKSGRRYAHAWVYDVISDCFVDIKFYKGEKVAVEITTSELVKRYNLQTWITYNVWQMIYLNWRYGTQGPYDNECYSLCNNGVKGHHFKRVKRLNPRAVKMAYRMFGE